MLIKPDENGKFRTNQLPTKAMLVIRILVGIYLYYLVFQLRNAFVPPIATENIPIIIASVAFVIFGAIVIIFSIRDLSSGRFQGGALDSEVLDDYAVKHIEGLDAPIESADTDYISPQNLQKKSSDSAEPSDDFDPHNVVYKKKKKD